MIRTPQQVLIRTPGHRDENERWVEGSETSDTILASVQPATSGDYDELQSTQAGRRIERVVRVYTGSRMNVAGEDLVNGDILLWEGSRYIFVAVSPWRTTALKHYRYLASKELEP